MLDVNSNGSDLVLTHFVLACFGPRTMRAPSYKSVGQTNLNWTEASKRAAKWANNLANRISACSLPNACCSSVCSSPRMRIVNREICASLTLWTRCLLRTNSRKFSTSHVVGILPNAHENYDICGCKLEPTLFSHTIQRSNYLFTNLEGISQSPHSIISLWRSIIVS